MDDIALALVVGSGSFVAYTYLGYPLALALLVRLSGRRDPPREPVEEQEWPMVSVTVPVYNEQEQIGEALEHLLGVDYPADRLQIMVVSDGSTDGTDEIVRSFASRGVQLNRRPERQGKTAAENAVAPLLAGDIVVNTDASIRIDRSAVKALVACFRDPGVGLASGRDISVSGNRNDGNLGESRYVGYEMWMRRLETETSGIVGASGCLYAIRSHLHRVELPENLSRDFAAALVARERGFRAVSVDQATCIVPRTASLRQEYRRKVRTMIRGIRTLHHMRHLLNPFRHGVFAWKLFSHKVCRWLSPWCLATASMGVVLLAASGSPAARVASLGLALLGSVAALGWFWPAARPMPRFLAMPAFAIWANAAALQACAQAPLKRGSATWEPTRRKSLTAGLGQEGHTASLTEIQP